MSYRIPLTKPVIPFETRDRVGEVLDSGFLTEGPVTRAFEDSFRNWLGCGDAIAVSSCTTGLEVALRCLGVGPGDKVIVPDYTHPATAQAVLVTGATAVIVDVSTDSMLIDYDALESAVDESTRAVMAVPAFGNPLDYERLEAFRVRTNLPVVEDAAPAFGARFRDQAVGTWADVSVFSFHPRKTLTTGSGGMITTENAEWAAWMRSYKHFGIETPAGALLPSFVRVGTNYRMSDILAAVGLAQMEVIGDVLKERQMLAESYLERLRDVPGVKIPRTTEGGNHAYQSFCIFVKNRDAVLTKLRSVGIEAQIGTFALHREDVFTSDPRCQVVGDPVGSRWVYDHCLTLPLYVGMKEGEQEEVVMELRKHL